MFESFVNENNDSNKKQIANYNIQPPFMYATWFLAEVALLNAVHALKFYRNITFHGRAATSEV
jgi:hypothetical protein